MGDKCLLAYNNGVECKIDKLFDYNSKLSQTNRDFEVICECLNKCVEDRIKLKKQNQNQNNIITNMNDERRAL